MSGREKPRILCVSRSPYQLREMRSALPAIEYQVLSASTPEQAVAVCLNNHIAAVVLDSEFCTEAGWTAAQTLKMVNPRLPVMLLLKNAEGTVPSGVDAVAPSHSDILPKLKGLWKPSE
ncbi:MAG TPA: response regulator [Candidatus Angelobacter sp.]|jgi:CheY-like chemotaxis protein|nr:response regulator [Candidatus Angelobacter sp.]